MEEEIWQVPEKRKNAILEMKLYFHGLSKEKKLNDIFRQKVEKLYVVYKSGGFLFDEKNYHSNENQILITSGELREVIQEYADCMKRGEPIGVLHNHTVPGGPSKSDTDLFYKVLEVVAFPDKVAGMVVSDKLYYF